MNKLFRPARLVLLLVLFVGVLSIYAVALYKLQIYDVAQQNSLTEQLPLVTTTRTDTIRAGRGDILDRNGVLLVSSRPSYDVVLSRSALLAADGTNSIIRDLIYMSAESGVAYNDTFPITAGAPFEYAYDMTATQRTRLDKYLDFFDELDADATADDLIVWMKKHYGIPYTLGITDARLIIGVRYELETRVIMNLAPYVFAEDIPAELISRIAERAYPGVTVEIGAKRVYHTTSAAHILGYLGRMDEKEYALYGAVGYPMDAVIGKSGTESAFEAYLHGTDGELSVRTSENGSVVSEVVKKEAVPGNHVYLSLDIELQATAERALADKIIELDLNPDRPEDQKVTGGAVVVTQVKTGEILASASYPSFDPLTRTGDEFNRATQGTYNPGSTFKMVTALAGMRAGTISRYTQIVDEGVFTEYPDYQPKCWLYTASGATHGALDVVQALEVSCNYFFYKVGDDTRLTPLVTAARDFGFGAKTGIEIAEATGVVATEEYKKETFNEGWWNADTLLMSIGQGLNEFTPVQLANYAATIAGGGTLHEITLLHNVKSADYSGIVFAHTPVTRSVIPEGDLIAILKEGMRAAVTLGTASGVFGNYKVPVAAKTGTVQTGSDFNNGVFVCYAPADDPEIAIATVVERGGSGAAIMEIAKVIMDEYFKDAAPAPVVGDGELLP
ncbi:MAG: hypothetical protein LBN99_05380 [Oscillospiraceae bacterium]|jgi:penicillin-binding protein 2|nr:hypothetical protein [Oscillospiraceae bacterium]